LYALHKLRDEMELSARVFEAGDGVGGTWYWNRYPGARSDTSRWIYCYSFDEWLLQEWQWSERYPQQHEVLGYLEHVADRFDLNRDIQPGTRVIEATFDEQAKRWDVRTDTGDVVSARFLVAALGALSTANVLDARPGGLQRRSVSHRREAPRGRRLHRQEGRSHRYGCHRHPGRHGDRRAGGSPHRLPAYPPTTPSRSANAR
jgi:cation diffusion facilitator CzcD-associated flavoprotein CzcO